MVWILANHKGNQELVLYNWVFAHKSQHVGSQKRSLQNYADVFDGSMLF